MPPKRADAVVARRESLSVAYKWLQSACSPTETQRNRKGARCGRRAKLRATRPIAVSAGSPRSLRRPLAPLAATRAGRPRGGGGISDARGSDTRDPRRPINRRRASLPVVPAPRGCRPPPGAAPRPRVPAPPTPPAHPYPPPHALPPPCVPAKPASPTRLPRTKEPPPWRLTSSTRRSTTTTCTSTGEGRGPGWPGSRCAIAPGGTISPLPATGDRAPAFARP